VNLESEYIAPYIISNIVAVMMLFLAWKKPNLSRLLYILLFGWASITNYTTAINTPEVYLDYAGFTFLPFYKSFIEGFFSEHITPLVLIVAICQFVFAVLLLAKGNLLNVALLGGILFFLGIAPLGVGAAFPSSLFWAIGLFVLSTKKLNAFRLKEVW